MLTFGYGCLGLLVGILAGLTSSTITSTVLASLFTLAGGSIAPVLKYSDVQRRIVGAALGAFCLCCLLGIFGGIGVKVNRTLDLSGSVDKSTPYLKAVSAAEINRINMQYKNREISADAAYSQLWEAIHR